MKGTFCMQKLNVGNHSRKLEKEDINAALISRLLRPALIGLVMFGSLFLAIPPSAGDFPPSPPDIFGRVYYSDDTPAEGAIVTLKNTRTGDEVSTETASDGTWCINMQTTIGAENGDEILITAFVPKSEEKEKSVRLVVDRSNYTQEVNFVFEKESLEGAQGLLPGGNGGSTSDELSENAAATEEERGAENISGQQPSPPSSPSSGIEEKGNESVAGEGQSEMPSPLKEKGRDEGEGKNRSTSGFQIPYAGAAGVIAVATLTLFVIKRFKGVEKRRN